MKFLDPIVFAIHKGVPSDGGRGVLSPEIENFVFLLGNF